MRKRRHTIYSNRSWSVFFCYLCHWVTTCMGSFAPLMIIAEHNNHHRWRRWRWRRWHIIIVVYTRASACDASVARPNEYANGPKTGSLNTSSVHRVICFHLLCAFRLLNAHARHTHVVVEAEQRIAHIHMRLNAL